MYRNNSISSPFSLPGCYAVHNELLRRRHCCCEDQEWCQSAVDHQPSQSWGHDTGAQQLYSYIHDLTLDAVQVRVRVSVCVCLCFVFVSVCVLTAPLLSAQECDNINERRVGGRTHCEVWGQGLEGRDRPDAQRQQQQTSVSLGKQN